MIELTEVIEELSTVFEKPVAEKLGQVMLSVYERLHESLVLQRLDLLERRINNIADEWRQFAMHIEEQMAQSRVETNARFAELAEAQRRTEERLERLAEEFAEYRKHTDARFAELAEAQRRTEERLERLAEEFAEYRKHTDTRFAELAEAQRRTAQEVASLAQEMRALAKSHKELQKQVGGMSVSFGYLLENEAIKNLPALLLQDHGIQVVGRLTRQFVRDRTGRDIEVNLFGRGTRDGETVTIVGESKSQLSKNDVDRFLRRTLSALEGVYPKLFPVMVTHMISEPSVETYARERGVTVYYSYDL